MGLAADINYRHEQVLANSTGIYSGYVKYQQRITGRRLRIFVLEPAPAD